MLAQKFFGVPVLLGVILALINPYWAFPLSTVIYGFLFIIMLLTALNLPSIDRNLILSNKSYFGFAIFLSFLLYPSIQWMLGVFLLKDQALNYGLFWAALSPIAIVAPQFVRIQQDAEEKLSHQMMILSLFVSPFALAVLTPLFFDSRYNINFSPLLKDLFILCAAPIVIAVPLRKLLAGTPRTFSFIRQVTPILNMTFIGLISYSLLGTTLVKVGFSSFHILDIAAVFVFTFIQDFGIYYLSIRLGRSLLGSQNSPAFFVPLSMKNIALAGSVLLFYHPKASFAASCGFLAHSIFFIYLSNRKTVKVYD